LNIPFKTLPYEDHVDGKRPDPVALSAESITETLSVAKIPSSTGFVPIHMEVVEKNSMRGDIPARVCLLGKDKTTYTVYALPRDWEPRMDVVMQEDMMMG